MSKQYNPGGYKDHEAPLGSDEGKGGNPKEQDQELDPKLEEAGANEEESEETDVEPDESEEDSSEDEFDYEAELEKERKRLGGKIDKERRKRIEAEKSRMDPEEVRNIVRDEVSQSEKRVLRQQAEYTADRLAKSEGEKQLILHHFEHSIRPTGNLEEDIENAYALANRRKFKSTISELRQAARSKQNRPGSSGAGAPPQQKKALKYTQEDMDGAKFAGVSVEDFVREKVKKS